MNIFGANDTSEILNGLIRIGEVCEVDYAKGMARVVFDDDDSIVSNYLQVIHTNTYDNHDYAMPDIGEDVVCIFLSSGMEEGFILGSIYAGEITPPETSKDKRTVVFSDETKVSYDRALHELTIVIEGTKITANRENVEVVAPKKVAVTAEDIEATASNTITATAKDIKADASSSLTATAGSSAKITSPTITLDGEVSVTGNITVAKSVTVTETVTAAVDVLGGGKSLLSHTHTGNQGTPTSPPL